MLTKRSDLGPIFLKELRRRKRMEMMRHQL
jgi:hypothetical protein